MSGYTPMPYADLPLTLLPKAAMVRQALSAWQNPDADDCRVFPGTLATGMSAKGLRANRPSLGLSPVGSMPHRPRPSGMDGRAVRGSNMSMDGRKGGALRNKQIFSGKRSGNTSTKSTNFSESMPNWVQVPERALILHSDSDAAFLSCLPTTFPIYATWKENVC